MGEFRGLQNPPPDDGDIPVDVVIKFSALDINPITASAAALADVVKGDAATAECSEEEEGDDAPPPPPPSAAAPAPPAHCVAGCGCLCSG